MKKRKLKSLFVNLKKRKRGVRFDRITRNRHIRSLDFRPATFNRRVYRDERPSQIDFKPSSLYLHPLRELSHPINKKLNCIRRVSRADNVRRKNFFRALAKGGTSSRPEHNRRHNRNC